MSPGAGDVESIADSIWAYGRRGVYYPDEWKGRLTMDGAYRVQLAILRRALEAGERQAGWKVGLTAPAMQAQAGLYEPVFGFLLESGEKASGIAFPFAGLIRPGVENELCLTIGTTLEGPGVTLETARAAVVAVAPALEVIERRGDAAADVPLSLADNCQQRAYVTGRVTSPLAAALDLSTATVEVYLNGRFAERATGAEVMGTPYASVAWLANRLAGFGRRLDAGMRVMSGSFTRQYAVDHAGDEVEARFAPFGPVAARFV